MLAIAVPRHQENVTPGVHDGEYHVDDDTEEDR